MGNRPPRRLTQWEMYGSFCVETARGNVRFDEGGYPGEVKKQGRSDGVSFDDGRDKSSL
jgi:hypothetical protein